MKFDNVYQFTEEQSEILKGFGYRVMSSQATRYVNEELGEASFVEPVSSGFWYSEMDNFWNDNSADEYFDTFEHLIIFLKKRKI